MSIDKLMSKRYDRNTYNCAHLAVDVWLELTGKDISGPMDGFLLPTRTRHVPRRSRQKWARHKKAVSPCIVLMRRKNTPPHVGVYFNGKIVHISGQGVQYQPPDVVTRGFTVIRYYSC